MGSKPEEYNLHENKLAVNTASSNNLCDFIHKIKIKPDIVPAWTSEELMNFQANLKSDKWLVSEGYLFFFKDKVPEKLPIDGHTPKLKRSNKQNQLVYNKGACKVCREN